MSLPVLIRAAAEEDIRDAAEWYQAQRNNLGQEFIDEVARVLDLIAEHPRMYPVVWRNTRRALMSKFPFGVFYRDETQRVVVVAVLHAKRHPSHWKERQ